VELSFFPRWTSNAHYLHIYIEA